jgi:hypothetical protein
MGRYIIFLVALFFSYKSSSQAPGLVIQSGLTTMYSKDPVITKDGEAHYGWMVGADARILEGSMYFIMGAQYVNTSLRSSSNPEFTRKRDWKMMNGRCGLGFNFLRLSESFALRSKILATVNFTLDAPSGALGIDGYRTLNDSSLGAVTGLGITWGMFDFDLEYQYGILNAYNKQPNSTFDGFTLMAGFHF